MISSSLMKICCECRDSDWGWHLACASEFSSATQQSDSTYPLGAAIVEGILIVRVYYTAECHVESVEVFREAFFYWFAWTSSNSFYIHFTFAMLANRLLIPILTFVDGLKEIERKTFSFWKINQCYLIDIDYSFFLSLYDFQIYLEIHSKTRLLVCCAILIEWTSRFNRRTTIRQFSIIINYSFFFIFCLFFSSI